MVYIREYASICVCVCVCVCMYLCAHAQNTYINIISIDRYLCVYKHEHAGREEHANAPDHLNHIGETAY